LNWIGKDAVVNHHLQVPFHLLTDAPSRMALSAKLLARAPTRKAAAPFSSSRGQGFHLAEPKVFINFAEDR
jgi:hypothetical protein